MTLKTLCEILAECYHDSAANIIELARPKLFDFYYPIFDENYKKDFETKFIKHFYLNEIGFETHILFKFELDESLNRIMPYYNKMYKIAYSDLDMLSSEDITEKQLNTSDNLVNNSINSKSNTKSDNLVKNSDTPQGQLQNFLDDKYLSSLAQNKTDNDLTSNSENESSSQNVASGLKTIKGYRGYLGSEIINKAYNAIKNIDNLVFDELSNLFMQIY